MRELDAVLEVIADSLPSLLTSHCKGGRNTDRKIRYKEGRNNYVDPSSGSLTIDGGGSGRGSDQDTTWMRHALELAGKAEAQGEVPVGAVIVRGNQLIAEGWNRPVASHDPTAHAEIVALRAAGVASNNYRLPGHTLYVTLEPCAMCAGAIIHARIDRLVYAADDPRAGAVHSVYDVLSNNRLNHVVDCQGGLLAEESASLLRNFFKTRR